jgi:hypothetical protein
MISVFSLVISPPCLLLQPLSVQLRLHCLDEIAERFPEILCLLSSQTLNQLIGDIRRALHLRQEVITEEINRFLASRLQRVSKEHGDFE